MELWRDDENGFSLSVYMTAFKNDISTDDIEEFLGHEYVEYLVDKGLIDFITEIYNSSDGYYTDKKSTNM